MLLRLATISALVGVTVLGTVASAAEPSDAPLAWTATWIAPAGAPPAGPGVYHFRRTVDLPRAPKTFVIHVTGDNRYQLFVNGTRVSWGPARGSVERWRYETVDIAPQLRAGKNVLAAVVWNHGEHAAMAQMSHRTGFWLAGHGPAERVVDTNRAWKAFEDPAYELLPMNPATMKDYYVAGPGERVHGSRYPWGWETPAFDETTVAAAVELGEGSARGAADARSSWALVPRTIPPMEERPERLQRVRVATGVTPPAGFPARARAFTIAPYSEVRLLLDQGHLTTAYPELVVSGGAGAEIVIGYAENLWGSGRREKGHRDDVEGKTFFGNRDELVADGGKNRLFRPLWWRTYRYVELKVRTQGAPLVIEDLRATYTGYPFVRRARFDARSAEIDKMLDIGWRTARLCAHETYMDCPYYEQLQYTGDTRIQALVSLYMTGDDRLMKNALTMLDDSRVGDAPSGSRFPSRLRHYIGPFALWWVTMLHDHLRYRDDPEFVRSMLPGVHATLDFFHRLEREPGVLGPLPWWSFVDWTKDWTGGVPPGWNGRPSWADEKREPPVPTSDPQGASAVLDLQLLLAYDAAAEIERAVGTPALADVYAARAATLRAAIPARYFDEGRKLFADTPKRTSFSQHANALAIIAGVVRGPEAAALMRRTLEDAGLTQASIYFRHYLHTALNVAGLGDMYLDLLGPWRRMMALGLTTWAETEDPQRSECHAWGASPNMEVFRTILGIDSAAPGWKRVRIRPFLGKLERASGAVPHPRGQIAVGLERRGDGLRATIDLPDGVEGELVWRGETRPLKGGRSQLELAGAPPPASLPTR